MSLRGFGFDRLDQGAGSLPGRTGTGNRRRDVFCPRWRPEVQPAERERSSRPPSSMKRAQGGTRAKAGIRDRATPTFQANVGVVVAHYAGLTVADMQKFRHQARQAGVSVKVAKNRLAKIALDGTDVASIAHLLKGPTILAYSADPVAVAKVTTDYAKANEKLVVLGGAMGKTALDPNGVKTLASLPSLDELRPSSWASSRLPRPSSPNSRMRPPRSSRAFSPPMATRTRRLNADCKPSSTAWNSPKPS